MKGFIFVYFLTIVGILVSLFYPLAGICIYMLFGVISPNALWYYSLPDTFLNSGIGYSEAVAYPMIVGWFLRHCGSMEFGKAFLPLACLIFFLLWTIFSSIIGGWNIQGQTVILMNIRLILAMVILITLCDTVKVLRLYLWILVIGMGFIAFELNMSYLQGFNRLQMIGYAGMDNNFFAVAMVVGTGIAFFVALSEESYTLKGIAFFAALLQSHVIMFSMSRGGMLGLLVLFFMIFIVLPKTWANIGVFGLASILMLMLAGDSVRERFSSAFEDTESLDSSAQSRLQSWTNCLVTMKEKPLTGIGLKRWIPYSQSRFGMTLEAHSTWFQTGVESGIPALLAQLAFFFFVWWRMIPYIRNRIQYPDPRVKYYAQMVLVCITGYGISAQFVSLYAMELIYYTCTMGLIILKLTWLLEKEAHDKELEEEMRRQQEEYDYQTQEMQEYHQLQTQNSTRQLP